MGNGYWQKTLRVNFTTGDIRVEAIDEKDLKAFIGGAGLGALGAGTTTGGGATGGGGGGGGAGWAAASMP